MLPTKLPPLKQPMPVTSLPMLGYLEQSVATAIINALSAVGIVKPKFPFITSTKSSLIYVAYHLKGIVMGDIVQCVSVMRNEEVIVCYLSTC